MNKNEISLSFKVDYNANADYSDVYLTNSAIKRNIKVKDILEKNIINNLETLDKKLKKKTLDELWAYLCQFIYDNDFVLKDVLFLKKGSSLKRFKNDLKSKIENVCIILISNDKNIINNTICFYVDLKHSDENNLEEFDIYLKRIEFLKTYNIKIKSDEKIVLSQLLDKKDKQTDIENWKVLMRKYISIFDDDDYDKEKDKIEINEWFEFIKKLKDLYNDKYDDKKLNYLFELENNIYLISSIEINSLKDYILYENNQGEEINLEQNPEINKIDSLNKFREISDSYHNDIANADEKIENNEAKQSKYSIDLNNKKKYLAINNNHCKNIIEKIKTFTDKINELTKVKNDLENKLKKQQKNDKKDDIEVFDINSIKKELKNNIDNLTQYEEQLRILKNKKNDINNEIDKIQHQVKNNENEIKKLSDENKQLLLFKSNLNYKLGLLEKLDEEYIKEYKYVYIFKYSDEKEINFPIVDENMSDIHEIETFSFLSNDQGTKAVINRMWNALLNIEKGYYKNPFFYLGIKDVHKLEIINVNKLTNEIQEKYKLNEKQYEAVTKAINTDSIFYLQGPPGTGKTQTICAISEYITKNNMNVVITSSTHEAINNFFDRFSEFNKSNPNVIAFKYRNIKSDEKDKIQADKEHDESSIFKKFKQRMKNNIISTTIDNSIEELRSKYNDFCMNVKNQKIDKENIILFFNKTLPIPLVEIIFKYWNNEDFKKQFVDKEDEDALIKPIGIHDELNDSMIKYVNKKIQDQRHSDIYNEFSNILKLHIEIYVKICKTIDDFKFNKNYFNELEKFINQNSSKSNNLESLINSINEKYCLLNNDLYEKDFLEYIIDNKLINVIGVTTTSENKIRLNGKDINLYNEYPIDYMIIDEISKCSTPEILSKAILAKKVLFVGDYLQLPPSANLNNDKIVKYLKDEAWNQLTEENDIKKAIEELFKTSFFKIQVERIKVNQSLNKPYEFLNESHRFGEKIMDIVNNIYPDDEKLIMPKNKKNIVNKYELKLNSKNLDSEAVIINLLKPTNKFCNLHNFNCKIDDLGFDQSGDKLFNHHIKLSPEGLYNQFSAFVISSLLKKIINQNKDKLNTSKRIGIITLTKNQKSLVRSYINKDGYFKDYKKIIKVDTIDNFQGREEEIVIVDFIRGMKKIKDTKIENTKKRNSSFLREKERINVALSRAKQKLILIGHFEYLKTLEKDGCAYFKNYYKLLYDSHDSYIEWSDECDKDCEV